MRVRTGFSISSRALATLVAIGAVLLQGCSAEDAEREPLDDTSRRHTPFPEPSAEVDQAADTVFVGTVLSHTSFDVPESRSEVVTVHRVRVDAAERGSLRTGEEVSVITRGGTTSRTRAVAHHEARPRDGLEARFFLNAVALDETELSAADAARAQLDGGALFRVTRGADGLLTRRSEQALVACDPPTGWCQLDTDDRWLPTGAIKYWINPNTTFAGAMPVKDRVMAIQSAFDAWNAEPSSWVHFEYQGTTTAITDPVKSIVHFCDTGGLRGDTTISGEPIVKFNICVDRSLTPSFTAVWHNAMHEGGHALGADHVSDTTQVMYPFSQQLVLGWGDRNFVNTVYHGATIPLTGDFDDNGKPDLVGFVNQSQWPPLAPVDVSLYDTATSSFKPRQMWNGAFGANGETPLAGDFDGDGKDDIVRFIKQGVNVVEVCLSNGTSAFDRCRQWHPSFGVHSELPAVGDFNGDGKDDVLVFRRDNWGQVFVALSDGTRFGTSLGWHTAFAYAGQSVGVGDFDRNGCDDIVTMHNGSGEPQSRKVFVALSQACNATNKQNKFGAKQEWLGNFCGTNKSAFAAYGDLFCVNHDGSAWSVARVNAARTGFSPEAQIAGAGGPIFNQTSLVLQTGSTQSSQTLFWFEHGYLRANVYKRTTGARSTVFAPFAPGPCPWNGVAGVCP